MIQAQTFRMSWGPEASSLWLTRPLGYWEAQLVCYICIFSSNSLSEQYQDSLTIILTMRWTFLYSHLHFKTTTHLDHQMDFFIFVYILN